MVTHTWNLSSAFNPSKCTLTAVNTHPEQWAAMLRRPGSSWGIGPCSRVSPQSWYWRWREHLLFTPPTDNPCRTWESNLQPLGYKSNSLTIRPRLPRIYSTYICIYIQYIYMYIYTVHIYVYTYIYTYICTEMMPLALIGWAKQEFYVRYNNLYVFAVFSMEYRKQVCIAVLLRMLIMRVKMLPKYFVRIRLTLYRLQETAITTIQSVWRLDPSQQRNYAFSYKMTNMLRRTKGKRCLENCQSCCVNWVMLTKYIQYTNMWIWFQLHCGISN